MKKLGILFAGILCIALSGCMETGTEKGAGIGAVSGGLIGGVIGHQSGRAAEGAGIGAASGAVLGAIIGHEAENSASAPAAQPVRRVVLCPNGHKVDVTGIPAGTRVRCPICGAEFTVRN